jgi:hypothetical protein
VVLWWNGGGDYNLRSPWRSFGNSVETAMITKKNGGEKMITLFTVLAAVSAKVAVEAFTGGALLGTVLYTASRTNKFVRHR